LLPRKARLSREKEIKAVLKTKQYQAYTPTLRILAADNQQDNSRIVIVTPKKLGKANFRNRLRRRLAAAFARLSPEIKRNIDIMAFPGRILCDVPFDQIVTDFKGCLGRISAL